MSSQLESVPAELSRTSDVNPEFLLSHATTFKSMAFRLRSNLEHKFNHDLGYLTKCENFDLGATSESSGGSRRLAKINKAPSPSSGSTSSTGSSGGKDKLKKVSNSLKLCLYCFVRAFISAATLQCFTFLLKEHGYTYFELFCQRSKLPLIKVNLKKILYKDRKTSKR